MKRERRTLTIEKTVLEQVSKRYTETTVWNRSSVISRDLGRYYYILDEALKMAKISIDEACAVIDVVDGTLMSNPESTRMLWAEIEDADKYDEIGKKWGIDCPAFVERLKNLPPLEAAALVDAAERFWTWEGHENADFTETAKRFFLLSD